MSQRLLNKVAVITGSSDGIGYSIAEKFLKEGSKVMISSRKQKNVTYAIDKLKDNFDKDSIAGIVCHVGVAIDRRKLISETVERFGNIDILVSNAGTNIHVGHALECNEDTWDKMMGTNVKSAFFLVREAVAHMNKNGSVIINSSIAGYNAIPLLGVYSITKSALIGMVKVLSMELGPSHDIRVNGLAPGVIKTKLSRGFYENETALAESLKNIHLKRLGTGEDCAGVAAFLASDDSAYVTGEIIVVSGGMVSRL